MKPQPAVLLIERAEDLDGIGTRRDPRIPPALVLIVLIISILAVVKFGARPIAGTPAAEEVRRAR